MVMKFDYTKIRPGVSRPVIPIELGYNGIFVRYLALIDSGADYSLFSAEVGARLGIDVLKGKRVSVIGIHGDSTYMYFHDISLVVGSHTYEVKAAFMPDFQ